MNVNVLFVYNDVSVFRTVQFIPRIGETVHINFDNYEIKTLKVLSVEHTDVNHNIDLNGIKQPMSVVIRLVKGKK